MVRQASISLLLHLNLFLHYSNTVLTKSGGGHYSSQRSLGAGPSGGHGAQQNYWGNSMYPPDINSWYEYGMDPMRFLKKRMFDRLMFS